MRILLVSSFLPYPLFNGGRVALYDLWRELSKNHKITLICEMRDQQTSADIAEVKKYCEDVITVPHAKPFTRENIFKTGFGIKPLLLVMHTNKQMRRKIVEALNAKRFDLIHVETFYVYQNLPKTYLPVVLVEHNIEYEVYERYMKSAPVYARPFLYIDIQKIRFWERKYWQKATKVIAVSEEDKKKITRRDSEVVSNGVDVRLFKFKSLRQSAKKDKKILFMGDFKWIQNRNSASWILDEIWQEINAKLETQNLKQEVKLWIVGRNIPEEIKVKGSEGVVFDEAQADTVKVYQN